MQLAYYWKKKTILSFVAIILVVIIHNSAINQYNISPDFLTSFTTFIHNFFAYGIGAIAVPIFFFISGISMFRNYRPNLYTQKLKSRIKTLLIPYLIWNTIGLLFTILYTYTPLSNIISGREFFEPTVRNILEGIFLYKYNFQFWFLYDLIIFVILTPIFNIMISKKWLSIIFSIVFLILPNFFSSFLNVNLYFVIFYFLGCFIGKHYLKLFTSPISHKTALITTVYLVLTIIIKLLSVYNIIQLDTIPSLIILITMLISAWFSADLFIPSLKQYKFTNEFFPIYTLHTYLLATIIKLIYLFTPKTSLMLLINELISPTLTIVIIVALAKFWHQKLPKSYQIMFGRK